MSDFDGENNNVLPFKNGDEKYVHKKDHLLDRMEQYLTQMSEGIDVLEKNTKLIYLCSEDLNKVGFSVEKKLETLIKEKTDSQSDQLKSILQELYTISERKVQKLNDQTEALLKKNRWSYMKSQWLITGAFSLGAICCSTLISYVFLKQNLSFLDEEIIHLSSLGQNLEMARDAMSESEQDKLHNMLIEAWKRVPRKDQEQN